MTELSITINPEYTDAVILRMLLNAYADLLVLNGADKAVGAKQVKISSNLWPRIKGLEIGGQCIVYENRTTITCLGMNVKITHDLSKITLIKKDE